MAATKFNPATDLQIQIAQMAVLEVELEGLQIISGACFNTVFDETSPCWKISQSLEPPDWVLYQFTFL